MIKYDLNKNYSNNLCKHAYKCDFIKDIKEEILKGP